MQNSKGQEIRIAIGQMNPTVGDYPANAKKIIRWIHEAETEGSDIIVFPECALSGYPVWDLANKKQFVEEGLQWLRKIAAATRGKKITAVVGTIDRSQIPAKPDSTFSKTSHRPFRSQNCMAWIAGGKILHRYAKRLLPTYDVFLENIFFEPGRESRVIAWKHSKIGPTICEDIWDFRYDEKPVQDLARQKADWILNISASPFFNGVAEIRDGLLKKHARQSHLPILYVNQVGAQDDLIFDGRSVFMNAAGRMLFRAPAFEEDLFFFDWDPAEKGMEVPLEEISKAEEVYQALVLGIRDYCRKNSFHKAVIGLSGGIDSALVAALAADALGPEVVCGVAMPGPYSSCGSWEDAEELAQRLGIEFRVYPIREKYAFIEKAYRIQRSQTEDEQKLTLAHQNLQARLRGLELMFISNDENRLLLSTGNKSELAMGYCTLYGDMAGGLSVLGDVYKTDVYALARWRNRQKEVIPKATMQKAPSAELAPGQKDEDSLPPYAVLDEILSLLIEQNKSADEIALLMKKKKVSPETVAEVVRRVDHNEYKRRQTPPILRVTEKAWFGRRMPITNRFEI